MPDFGQQRICWRVTERVVDVFETVEIKEQQRAVLVLSMRLGNALLEQRIQLCAVGQVGQRVEIGKAVNLLFRLLSLGNIGKYKTVMGQPSVGVMDRADGGPRRVAVAALALRNELARPFAMAVHFTLDFCPATIFRAQMHGRRGRA